MVSGLAGAARAGPRPPATPGDRGGPAQPPPRPPTGSAAATGRERAQLDRTLGFVEFPTASWRGYLKSSSRNHLPTLGRHRGACGFLETAPWQRLPCGDVTSSGGRGRVPEGGALGWEAWPWYLGFGTAAESLG